MRNEEEKTKDIFIHEKRTAAKEAVEVFQKQKRFAVFCTLIFFAALLPFCMMLARKPYDDEKPLLCALIFAFFAVCVFAAYLFFGKIFSKNRFPKKSRLAKKWRESVREMNKIEEKASMKAAFDGDVEKCENELLDICDEIIRVMNNEQKQ